MSDLSLTLVAPDGAELTQIAHGAKTVVAAITIDSVEMMNLANDELGAIKTKVKQLTERQAEILRPLAAVEKSVRDLFREPLKILTECETVLKGGIATFLREQQRIAREAQAAAEARARAEREAAERESARIAAEALAKAQALQTQADVAVESGNVGQAAELALESKQVAQAGMAEAAAVESTGLVITAPPPPPPIKAAGVSVSYRWKAKVADKARFVAFVAKNPHYLHLLDVSQSGIDALARAMHEALETAVDGLEAINEPTVSKRT